MQKNREHAKRTLFVCCIEEAFNNSGGDHDHDEVQVSDRSKPPWEDPWQIALRRHLLENTWPDRLHMSQ